MKIERRTIDDVMVLALDGRLVRGVGDELLRSTLDDVLSEGHDKVILDLSGVPVVDSSGVGELVAGRKVAAELGAQLKLVRLGDRVRHTLSLGLLLPLFEIYDSEEEALAAFGD